jgi:hypothetical protein
VKASSVVLLVGLLVVAGCMTGDNPPAQDVPAIGRSQIDYAFPKLSYVEGFAPYQWAIGAGIYMGPTFRDPMTGATDRCTVSAYGASLPAAQGEIEQCIVDHERRGWKREP